jgi:Conjugal transfer protein TrbH./Sporulation related domain.
MRQLKMLLCFMGLFLTACAHVDGEYADVPLAQSGQRVIIRDLLDQMNQIIPPEGMPTIKLDEGMNDEVDHQGIGYLESQLRQDGYAVALAVDGNHGHDLFAKPDVPLFFAISASSVPSSVLARLELHGMLRLDRMYVVDQHGFPTPSSVVMQAFTDKGTHVVNIQHDTSDGRRFDKDDLKTRDLIKVSAKAETKRKFWLQLAMGRNKPKLEKHAKKLSNAGWPVQIFSSQDGRSILRVGPYRSKKRAADDRDEA